jgi:hypothetical protein
MRELTELRIGDNIIGLGDNIVKTSILPKVSSELDRDVAIQGNVIIEGAVFGRNIVLDNGPADFHSAVYAHRELHIKNSAQGEIWFRKAVASNDSIVALLVSGLCIFGSDMNCNTVKLKNCFVAGSIFSGDIQLENCVVLGGCFASRKLTLQNAIVGTFNAPEVNAGGVNYLLYPTAFSVEPMAILPGTEFYNITLADLGALFKGEEEKPNTGKIRLDINSDSQRTILVDDADTRIVLQSYSVAGRILASDLIDYDKLENHFLIISASLGSQIIKTYNLQKEDGGKSEDLTMPNIAAFFFKILSGQVQIREMSGAIAFDELKQMYQ